MSIFWCASVHFNVSLHTFEYSHLRQSPTLAAYYMSPGEVKSETPKGEPLHTPHSDTHVSYRCPPSTRCSTKASWRTCRVEWGKAACIQGSPITDIRMLMRPDSTRSQW